jgi:hypothetical protein
MKDSTDGEKSIRTEMQELPFFRRASGVGGTEERNPGSLSAKKIPFHLP